MGIIVGLAGLISALIFGIATACIVWSKTKTKKWWFIRVVIGFIIGAIVGLLIGGGLGWLYISSVM